MSARYVIRRKGSVYVIVDTMQKMVRGTRTTMREAEKARDKWNNPTGNYCPPIRQGSER